MKTHKIPSLLAVSVASSFFYTNQILADDSYYAPPMVSIPAGEFMMGSDRGKEDEKPVRKVSISAFQMGKNEVTVAEYRKFVEDTGYQGANACTHRIGKRWFGSGESDGNWQNNTFATNEFYPVVCVSRTDAINYAKWLSDKTGQHYRLPTEAEWEYTVRAGTTTRFFYGEQAQSEQTCKFGNLSDYHAANMSGKLYDAHYTSVYTIEPCVDGEVMQSVVGLYEPNPFGVHGLLGNVVERLADCYVDNYQDAPSDGSAVVKDDCQTYAARGSSWHWQAFTSSERFPMSEDFIAGLEGFRLALDTGGEQLPSQVGSEVFNKRLAKAQQQAKAEQETIDAYPEPPQGLNIVSASKEKVVLSWFTNNDKHTRGYRVLRTDPMSNNTEVLANNVKVPSYVDNKPLMSNARYQVVAVNGKSESLRSNSVDAGAQYTHQLPKLIQGEDYSSASALSVRASTQEPEDDKLFLAIGDKSASYQLTISEAGQYRAKARVFYAKADQQLEFWLGDRKILATKLEGDTGWHTLDKLILDLPAGTHQLTVKGTHRRLALNWFDIQNI